MRRKEPLPYGLYEENSGPRWCVDLIPVGCRVGRNLYGFDICARGAVSKARGFWPTRWNRDCRGALAATNLIVAPEFGSLRVKPTQRVGHREVEAFQIWPYRRPRRIGLLSTAGTASCQRRKEPLPYGIDKDRQEGIPSIRSRAGLTTRCVPRGVRSHSTLPIDWCGVEIWSGGVVAEIMRFEIARDEESP